MATDVQKLIVAIETIGVDKAQKELDKLKQKAGQAEKATVSLGNKTKQTNQYFGKMRGATSALTNTTGQLSVQLQDVGVQLQQGTDAVRIFAQQGPQIASIFGPSGAVVGAVIAFAALLGGPFIKSLFNAGESIDELIKKANELEINLQKEFPLIFAEKLKELTKEEKSLLKETINITKAIAEEEAVIADMQSRMEEGTISQLKFENSTKSNRESIASLNRELQEEQLLLQSVQDSIASLFGFQSEQDKQLEEMKESLEKLTEKLKEEVATYGMGELALIHYNAAKFETLGLNAEEAKQLATTLQLKKNEEDVEKRLAKFREERNKLEESARKKRQAEEERETEQAERLRQREAKRVEDFQRSVNERRFELIVEAQEKRVEEEERQAEEAMKREEEREQYMAEIRAKRFENIQNAADERRRVEAEKRKQQEEEEIAGRERVTNALLSFEDKLMKGKSEKQKAAFRLGVNLANAEKRENAKTILSDSYTAAMKAYKSLSGIPIIGPALGAAAAGVIIAAGASYATQSLAGRALGGQVRDGESYVVGERGPEVLTMGSSGRIIPNDKLRGEQQVVNKTANITFQVNTVDARGFDQLLQSRRGQIISMVNTAMNDKGRRGVV